MKTIIISYIYLFFLFFSTVNSFDLFGLGSRSKPKSQDLPPVSDQKAQQYLQNFGYLGPSNFIAASPRNGGGSGGGNFQGIEDTFKSAVRKFQQFAGLSPTGKLDVQTKKKMAQPRCGVTDVLAISSTREAAFKWNKQRVTYAILGYSSDMSQDDVKKALRRAFDTWSEVVPLDFTEVSPSSSPDIKIQFASMSHGDPWPFDGEGGVLAHATMPTSGLLHFDEDERWTYMNSNKIANGQTDLLNVAIHESGHALGLSHSTDENSIMAPFYHETLDSNGNYIIPKLKSSDIQAIQDIYGSRRGGSRPRPSSSNTDDIGGFGNGRGGGSSGSGFGSGFGRGSRFGGRGSTNSDFGSDFGDRGSFGSWNPWGSDRNTGGSRSRLNWASWSAWSDSDDFGGSGFGNNNRGRTRLRGNDDDSDTASSNDNTHHGSDWFRSKLRSVGGSLGRFLEG